VTIGQEISEVRQREKGPNTSSMSQWHSASRMMGGHNKTRKAKKSQIIYVWNLVTIGSFQRSYNKKI